MKLYGFTYCKNESKMIPYVMPYIERMGYDKFIVYDNESTDNTVELLSKYPFIEIRALKMCPFDDDKITDCFFEVYQECWNLATTGEVIWLTRTDFDEVLFLDGIGCCNGKSVLNGEYLSSYNVFDGKMVELVCGEDTIQDKGTMAHTWKNIRGKYWHIYGNKPTIIKVNDLSYIACCWGNHGMWTSKDVELKHMQETGYVYGFHLKWLDKELLKERTQNMVKTQGTNDWNTALLDNIDRYYKESLLPLSFPLSQYFLVEGSKAVSIGGLKTINA